jgi:hypothetical protein
MSSNRVARGSLSGGSSARADRRPNLVGSLVIEQDLPKGTRLHLAGWTANIVGSEFVSLSASIPAKGSYSREPTTAVST